MNSPLISIIIPTYNSQKYIHQTLKSVFEQTIQDWELLLIDDGSSDNTKAIIQTIQEQEPRIKVIFLPQNAGPANARNMGIKNAAGKFITFLDADDIWFPNFLERSLQECKKGHPFVFASYKRLDENLNPLLPDFIVPKQVDYDAILKTNSISCLTAFINIDQLGKKYMPLVKKRQDMGLWLQYLKEIDYAIGIKEPLAIYRIRKHSLSRNKWQLLKPQWYFYRKVENLSIPQSIYYMFWWSYNGLRKYKP